LSRKRKHKTRGETSPAGAESVPEDIAGENKEVAQPDAPRAIRLARFIVMPVLFAVLMVLSFPPYDVRTLGLWAMIPLFYASLSARTGRAAAKAAFASGFLFWIVGISWLFHVGFLGLVHPAWVVVGVAALAAYMAAYMLFGALAYRFFTLRFGGWGSYPAAAAWVALEWIRAHAMTGFPWFIQGHSLHSSPALIQVAELAGAYGVSFLCCVCSGTAAYAAQLAAGSGRDADANEGRAALGPRNVIPRLAPLGTALILVVAAYLWGVNARDGLRIRTGPKLAMIQGNIPQLSKDPRDLTPEESAAQQTENLEKHIRLSRSIGGDGGTAAEAGIDMLVWSETMMPGLMTVQPDVLKEPYRTLEIKCRRAVAELAKEFDCHFLVGVPAWGRKSPNLYSLDDLNRLRDENNGKTPNYNSVILYSPEGRYIDRYDKIALVPFGEYAPLADYIPLIGRIVPMSVSFGRETTIFELPLKNGGGIARFGVPICYEDTVAELCRKFRLAGAQFLVNISNDAWFATSNEYEQHLCASVFRAVENRVGVARCGNTGITAFIDPAGRVHPILEDKDGRRKGVEGTLAANVKIADCSPGFYTKHGDVFVLACSAAVVVAWGFALYGRKPA